MKIIGANEIYEYNKSILEIGEWEDWQVELVKNIEKNVECEYSKSYHSFVLTSENGHRIIKCECGKIYPI